MLPDPLIGKRLSNLRIQSVLGRGGMAQVYYAWDEKLQRPAAVKVIDERYRGHSAYTERFVREASFIASWRHPNILQVYFAGEEDGLVYYVMEYIAGRDLGKALAETRAAGGLLPVAEALRIIRAVGDALDYAHQRGIIHRDVKPANVIVASDGRVVLTDFGIAMNVAQGTMGEVFGSPHYISPEQAQNSALAVPQSDLYALGVMAYEMLTGFVPFDDPSPAALAYQHISQPPPAPRALNPQLPLAVEAVLLKTLRKVPQERYSSGRELADGLSGAFDSGLAATHLQAAAAVVPPLRAGQAAFVPGGPSGGAAAARYPGGSSAPPAAPATGGSAGRRGGASRWLAGCAVALIGIGLLSALAASNAGWVRTLFAPASNPTGTAPAVRPSATAVPRTLPPPTHAALPPSATPKPSVTPLPIPSATPDPTATLTATPSPTAAATETPTPSATPEAETVQFLVPNHTSALLVINQTDTDLPLANLHLRSGASLIQGDAWDALSLQKGECALVFSDPKDPGRVGNLPCKLAHDPLRWTGGSAFWTKSFDILYVNQKVGTCTRLPDRENGCTSSFPLPAPDLTPSPFP